MNRQIGIVNKQVIKLLNLELYEEIPIYVGDNNIEHMKKEHYDDFERYR